MQLSQLEYLQAVASYGGVRKAARAVHVSPQAVSSAIKKLESEYQIVLLDRSVGEAVLSPAGREFARRARAILAQVDDLKKYAQSRGDGVSPDGHFRLYAPCLHGRGRLFAENWYDSFERLHPQIHLDVWHQPTAACFESLMLGIPDAAISFEEPRDSALSSKYLGEKELKVLSCPAGHQSVDAMTIRELLGGRLAVPINLSPCLNAINHCPEAQLVNFRFRDVEYGSRAQVEFLQAGGLILSFSGSSLASDGSEVSECSIEESRDVTLPIYFCYRHNAWTDRHQTVFLHLLRHLAS